MRTFNLLVTNTLVASVTNNFLWFALTFWCTSRRPPCSRPRSSAAATCSWSRSPGSSSGRTWTGIAAGPRCVVVWTITILFPIRSEVLPLAIGFFLYMLLIPIAEASEQTVIQKVVPFREQGRVFGFAQSVETAASPVTAFLIGPIAQFWVIPSMTGGTLAELVGPWFGTGPARAMALIFIIAGALGLIATLLALRSRAYRQVSGRYDDARDDDDDRGMGVAGAMA